MTARSLSLLVDKLARKRVVFEMVSLQSRRIILLVYNKPCIQKL